MADTASKAKVTGYPHGWHLHAIRRLHSAFDTAQLFVKTIQRSIAWRYYGEDKYRQEYTVLTSGTRTELAGRICRYIMCNSELSGGGASHWLMGGRRGNTVLPQSPYVAACNRILNSFYEQSSLRFPLPYLVGISSFICQWRYIHNIIFGIARFRCFYACSGLCLWLVILYKY